MKYLAQFCLLVVLAFSFASTSSAQVEDAPKHEFRAAWIASVTNLDWPLAGVTDPATQTEHLIEILDGLQEVGINAVIFQVRPEADALYQSDIEPWSYWLTGEQGKAPDPVYDPLTLVIEESHKRGMELHAWFNPYRVEQVIDRYPRDESHVSVENPDWTFSVGGTRVLDPGLPQVRGYVTEVIMDVVRRYDIDGVHFDDYFYPYPPDQVTNEDDETFAEHNRGITNRGAWRRDNVNLLMEMVNDSINAVKPHIKFGVSPFGIWRNGVPAGIIGLDAYNVVYADAVAWLDAESIDYITPQLYWKFGGAQDYERLANWWASQRNDRHFYPGLGAYKTDIGSFWNPDDFTPNEIPRQVRFNRNSDEIQGSVIFRSSNLTRYPSKGLADSLRQNIYTKPALTPPMEWKSMMEPSAPMDLGYEWMQDDTTVVEISWREGDVSDGAADTERYAVYRVYADDVPNLSEIMTSGENLIAITGETSILDRPSTTTTHYFVTSVSANSIESTSDVVVSLEGRATSAGIEQPTAFQLHQNYPNPFKTSTTIRYAVREAGKVTLRVYDVMGREVAVLQEGLVPAGSHSVAFEANNLASGTYLYVLDTQEGRQARTLTLLK